MSSFINLSSTNFTEEVLESNQAVVVMFTTDGCGPCEAMKPMLNELQTELENKASVKTFNIPIEEVLENSNEIGKKYDVMSFPTLLIFKDGEVKSEIIGSESKETLIKLIEQAV